MSSNLSRKDLIKLSKVQLIKRCKKAKLNTVAATGTKTEMINSLLKKYGKKKTKSKKSLTTKKSKSVPFKIQSQYLSSGYIRKNLLNDRNHDKYPISISEIILKYFGNMFLRFNLCHNKYINYIKSDGMIIERPYLTFQLTTKQHNFAQSGKRSKVCWKQSVVILFACSYGLKKGKHIWKITHLQSSDITAFTGIGIVKYNDIHQLCSIENLWHHKKIKKYIKKELIYTINTKQNDEMIIELNCTKNRLIFIFNKKKKKLIDLEPSCMWCPVLVSYFNAKYQLMIIK